MLHQWLASGDPRLIAWAAYFTDTTHDLEMVPAIEQRLQHWPAPVIRNDGEGQREQRLAALALLDTLIRIRKSVSTETIEAIEQDFPEHAILLAQTLPLDRSGEMLYRWTTMARGDLSQRTRARVAAMMRAVNLAPGAVEQIVEEAEENLTVMVVAEKPHGMGMGVGGTGCDTSRKRPDLPGWPTVYNYSLEENGIPGGTVLLSLGVDTIRYYRFPEGPARRACYPVSSLNAVTRHHLIAYWLKISPDAMPWFPSESEFLVWADKAEYERQLGHIVQEKQEKLRQSVLELQQRGLLSTDRRSTNRQVMPRLSLNILCSMKPCPIFQ